MSIKEEQRLVVMERLADHLLAHGLARTSLRQLADAADVSDRMLLYYFRDKAEVLFQTIALIGAHLAAGLDAAIPAQPRLKTGTLAMRAAEVTSSAEMRPYMRLWIEIAAAAAQKQAPYVDIAQSLMEGFRQWLEPRLDMPEGPERQAAALAVIAICDGLVLIDICNGSNAADQQIGSADYT